MNQLESSYIEMLKENKECFFRLALSYVHNSEDALDAVGEATYKGYKALKTLKSKTYMKTWFSRIVINESLAILRKKKDVPYDMSWLDQISENELDRDMIIDLHRALDRIGEEYRHVIQLKYFQGFTIKEIALTLQMNVNTVKSKLHRGIKFLEKEMEGAEYGK
jgi:RNA polymerase sigma-70 factor (ECF subfamily)